MAKKRNARRRRAKKRRKLEEALMAELAKVTVTPDEELAELEEAPQLELVEKITPTSTIPDSPPNDRASQAYKDWHQTWCIERNVPEPPDPKIDQKAFNKWRSEMIYKPRKQAQLSMIAGFKVQYDLSCPHGSQTANSTWGCECPLCYIDTPKGKKAAQRKGNRRNLIMPFPPERLDLELLKFYASRPAKMIPQELIEYLRSQGYVGPATALNNGFVAFSSHGDGEEIMPTEETPQSSNGHKPPNGDWMMCNGIGIPKTDLESMDITENGLVTVELPKGFWAYTPKRT